jgi:hypothetical protein
VGRIQTPSRRDVEAEQQGDQPFEKGSHGRKASNLRKAYEKPVDDSDKAKKEGNVRAPQEQTSVPGQVQGTNPCDEEGDEKRKSVTGWGICSKLKVNETTNQGAKEPDPEDEAQVKRGVRGIKPKSKSDGDSEVAEAQ